MPYRAVDAVKEASCGRRKIFQLYAGALEKSLNCSVIIVSYVFYLVRSARLLQSQELLKFGLGLRAVRFRRGHQQYRQRYRGIGTRRVGGCRRKVEQSKKGQRGQACRGRCGECAQR